MNLSKSKIFLLFCLAFILGVFLGKFINYETMAIAAMVFIILISVWWPARHASQLAGVAGRHNRAVFILAIAGVVALIGSVRFKTDYAKKDLKEFYNQPATIEGIVSEEPDVRIDKIYLTLGQVLVNGRKVESKILVSIPKYREFEYGEKIKFTEKISEPKEYPDFSYKNYLSRYGIDAVVYQPKAEILHGNFGNRFMFSILNLKKKFVRALDSVLVEPQNSLLDGLLLGAKRSIPEEVTEQFSKTGMSHIVAVSGYNISIIAIGIGIILQFLGLHKRISFFVSIPIIILFVIMIGASSSAVRAGVMGILLLLAYNVGRVSVAANSLAFTATVMIAINPQILLFDVGFQLSFAAIIGLVYLVPVLEPNFFWMPDLIRRYVLATLAAQVFALPLLLYYFGTLSVVSLLPNLLILPMIPLTMLSGFITGLVALASVKFAWPFAYVTQILLSYILGIVQFFANMSFAAVSIKINWLMLVILYSAFGGFLVWYYRSRSLQKAEIAVNLQHAKESKHELK